jgi:hypothetical protein
LGLDEAGWFSGLEPRVEPVAVPPQGELEALAEPEDLDPWGPRRRVVGPQSTGQFEAVHAPIDRTLRPAPSSGDPYDPTALDRLDSGSIRVWTGSFEAISADAVSPDPAPVTADDFFGDPAQAPAVAFTTPSLAEPFHAVASNLPPPPPGFGAASPSDTAGHDETPDDWSALPDAEESLWTEPPAIVPGRPAPWLEGPDAPHPPRQRGAGGWTLRAILVILIGVLLGCGTWWVKDLLADNDTVGLPASPPPDSEIVQVLDHAEAVSLAVGR